MYNSSVQLRPISIAKIKRTKFQVSRLRQSRSIYTGIVTGTLNLVLWPYYQMTSNKLFILPFTICTKHLQKIRLGIVSSVTPETQLLWRLCGEFRCLAFAPRRTSIFWLGQLWKLLRNLILSLSVICIRSFYWPFDWLHLKIRCQCCLLKVIYQLLT